jgi:hypothetical protein
MEVAGTAIAVEAGEVAIDSTRCPRPAGAFVGPFRPAVQILKGILTVGQKYWHVPIPTRPICPVCKKAVYSRAGIHPQCAVSQAESLRPVKPEPPHADAPAPSK